MEIFNKHKNIKERKYCGVGLGNFDGLHLGHMILIDVLINECNMYGLSSLIYTFTKHPENILRKKLLTQMIYTPAKKEEILKKAGLDFLYYEEFDEEFSRMKPENFVKDILVNRLNMKLAVAGQDYKFGYRGHGDVEYLKKLSKKYGFRVVVIPSIRLNDNIISSTNIRQCISRGYMAKAFEFMGRHYSISGVVSEGRKIGSKIGFPTANIIPEEYLVLPHRGVYITKTLIDNILYDSITNVGKNPTFEETENTQVETHILNYNKNTYNKKIEVFFLNKIRGERKFDSKEDLIAQINKDIEITRQNMLLME